MKVAQWWLGALVWAMFHSSATGTPELSSLTVAGAGATADWLPEFAAQTETYGIGLNENSTVPHVQIRLLLHCYYLAGVTYACSNQLERQPCWRHHQRQRRPVSEWLSQPPTRA